MLGKKLLPNLSVLHLKCKYVDDCALPEVVIVDKSESLILQHEVDNVNQWSTTSNMKLNVKKTK
jgi:hypothetical protein